MNSLLKNHTSQIKKQVKTNTHMAEILGSDLVEKLMDKGLVNFYFIENSAKHKTYETYPEIFNAKEIKLIHKAIETIEVMGVEKDKAPLNKSQTQRLQKVGSLKPCAKCKTNPRMQLIKKKTGKKYFYTYCKECEKSRK